MVDVIPAILPKNFETLKERLSTIYRAVPLVQIDVVDGRFARPATWPYRNPGRFQDIVDAEGGLPYWDAMEFQFDLMVAAPAERVIDFVRAGGSQIVLHARSGGAAQALQKLLDLSDEGGETPEKIGIALMPDAQPDELEAFEAQFDFVQVMGIATVGAQGRPFDERAVYLLERLRRRYPALLLQVDGGVTLENARSLARTGVNRLVVGHDIFDAKDPVREIAALSAEANRP